MEKYFTLIDIIIPSDKYLIFSSLTQLTHFSTI